MLQKCSRGVFKCFKWMERVGDAVTGAVGPVFVFFATVLLSMGIFSFFELIAPTLSAPLLSVPCCLLLAMNLVLHYYWACTVSPGLLEDHRYSRIQSSDSSSWASRLRRSDPCIPVHLWETMTPAPTIQCRRCPKIRPERAHHCRICKSCILKYDHHCPVRINQCVGLGNERHFILFMAYLVICCSFFVTLGWPLVITAMELDTWMHLTPRMCFMLVYILAVALGFAVGVMLFWQLRLVYRGETAVENHDNARYTGIAKKRGNEFINSFDLGLTRNFLMFFNIGPQGYSAWTLIVPARCMPYTDGWSWARRPGMDRHQGIEAEDELTDDEL
ncbi:zf-DHHC-domain-containing protein [Cantharellus anzutake]|uniref:zf-DHHC-domain-containing protein n=1 Tax=Cantharellus anzutake TaxID=1750568 RepID=UPI0019058ED0|nr:zf-DHHC-domain-containing protein [Cantharellus anzutake]KAF8332380.1 zf-DHHC-domain-containing protein [Cantharellus anzutake]